MVVIFNPREESTTVALPDGNWEIFIDGDQAGTDVLGNAETEVFVAPISAMVLVKEAEKGTAAGILVPAVLVLTAAAAIAGIWFKRRKK